MSASKYKPEFIDILYSMRREGKSITQVAVELGLPRQTLYNWTKTTPEWKEAMDYSEELALAWWEELGRQLCCGIVLKVPPVTYIYNMKARFGGQWLNDGTNNKLEITTKRENVTDTELKKMIEEKLARTVLKIDKKQGEVIDITPKLVENDRSESTKS